MALSEQEEFELLSLEREKAMSAAPAQAPQTPQAKAQEPGMFDWFLPKPINERQKQMYEDVMKKRPWGSGFSPAMRELGGKVTDITGSPALGTAAYVAGEVAPALLTAGRMETGAAPALETGAKKLMQSALKPSSKDIVSGDAAKAIETLLKENATVTSKGAAKLRMRIAQLESEAKTLVGEAAKRGEVVDKGYVMSEVSKELKKFANQVTPGADVNAVLARWEEFNNRFGAKIPVEQALELKKGTYKILADKYAKMGAVENVPGTQAEMAMARGLRRGTEAVTPGLGEVTAQESRIINALELAEKRAGIAGNHDIGGIAWLAHNPKSAAVMMADRSPAFKSWLANRLYQYSQSAQQIPGAVRAGTVLTAEEFGKQK